MLCALLCFSAFGAGAQDKNRSTNHGSSVAGSVLKGVGKAAVVVVGTAAKATWVVAKVTIKQIAYPVAKAVLIKAAPKVTVFMLKNTGKILKTAFPAMIKLALL